MIIPDKATLIKYKKLLNMDKPSGSYVDIEWVRSGERLPEEIKYETAIDDIISKLVKRFTKQRANILKFRSIIRKAKQNERRN